MGASDELRRDTRRKSSLVLGATLWTPNANLQWVQAGSYGGWHAVAALAARQHGVCAVWQLQALGLADRTIRSRCATGHLHRIHRGVYAVGHPALSLHGRLMAAVLAAGPASGVGRLSAAHFQGLIRQPPLTIHLEVPVDSCRRHQGLRIHRTSGLLARDMSETVGIPTVSPARALLAVSAELGEQALHEAADRARRRRILDVAALADLLRRCPRQRGTAALRGLLDALQGGALLNSELERAFLRLCREPGIGKPVVNGLVRTEHDIFQVDFHWPDAMLIVETDGYAFHSGLRSHEEDRRRDQELRAIGWEVSRYSYRQVTRQPARTTRLVRQRLAERRAEIAQRRARAFHER